jgi:hypothetical protein
MRFVVTKDGKHVEDIILSAVSFGTRFKVGDDDVLITNLYVENRGSMLAVDWIAYGQHGKTYRGFAVDILLK